MSRTRWTVVSPLLLAFAFSGSGLAQTQAPQNLGDVPAYNSKPPAPGTHLPPILKPEQLAGVNPQHPSVVTRAYQIAARIQRTLFQLPCYCRCDQGLGHNSLRSCYAGDHAAHCHACLQELYYADKMLKQGKTAEQIRAGIERGEWQQVDLSKV